MMKLADGDFITPYGTYEIINLVLENSILEICEIAKKIGVVNG